MPTYDEKVKAIRYAFACLTPIDVTPGPDATNTIGYVACGECKRCQTAGVQRDDNDPRRPVGIPSRSTINPSWSPLPWRVQKWMEHAVRVGPNWVQRDVQQLLDTFEHLTDLEKAKALVKEIDELLQLQKTIKLAFAKDELDGGWKTALEHPLYLEAENQLQELFSEMKGLI